MKTFLSALARIFPVLPETSTCRACGGHLQVRVDGRRCPDCGHLYPKN